MIYNKPQSNTPEFAHKEASGGCGLVARDLELCDYKAGTFSPTLQWKEAGEWVKHQWVMILSIMPT